MLEEKKVSELNDDELQRVAGGYSLTANFDSGDWFLNDQTLYKVNPSNTSTTDLASKISCAVYRYYKYSNGTKKYRFWDNDNITVSVLTSSEYLGNGDSALAVPGIELVY